MRRAVRGMVMAGAHPRRSGLAIALLGLALTSPAAAQDEDDPLGIEQIFVMAEKKESDLQRTGGSVAAFTRDMLEERGIYDVKGISDYVPNLIIHTNPGDNTGFAVNIRGAIKGDPIISREPAVGLYVDDVYMASMVGVLFDVLDLEHIEVLRGPQGTLYGRNTNGGAIKLRTAPPSDHVFVRSETSYGNFDAWTQRSTVNLPLLGAEGAVSSFEGLGDLNTRTSFGFFHREGFVDVVSNDALVPTAAPSVTGGYRLDDLDRYAVHHRTRWEPLDWLTFDYIFDKAHAEEEPAPLQLSAILSDADGAPGGSPLLDGTLLGAFGIGVDATPFSTDGRASRLAGNVGATGLLPESLLDIEGHAVTATATLPRVPVLGEMTAKSISAKRSRVNDDSIDADGTGYEIFSGRLEVEHEQFSQEFQLNGLTAAERVDYVAGIYYFKEEGQALSAQAMFTDPAFAFVAPSPTRLISLFHAFEKRSVAGYGQANYTPPILDDRLTLSGGLRYTDEEVSMDALNVVSGVCKIDTGVDGSEPTCQVPSPHASHDRLSWLARLQVQASEDVMAYFKVNTGFLAGGFNARNLSHPSGPLLPGEIPFGTPYEPEDLLAYELGVRTEFFDRRLRFNATWFYYDYEDIQVSIFSPSAESGAATVVRNAAAASIWGAEVELSASPLEGLLLDFAYGFTNPEYEEFLDYNATTMAFDDRAGSSVFAQTPRHSLAVSGKYTLPPFRWGTLSGRLDWSWQDTTHFSTVVDPTIDTPSHWNLNAMIELADFDLPARLGRLRGQLWAKNVTNEDYKEFGFRFQLPALGGWSVNSYNDPRTYGFTLVWDWEA